MISLESIMTRNCCPGFQILRVNLENMIRNRRGGSKPSNRETLIKLGRLESLIVI